MTTLAVIPARLGATRLPRKPLRLLAGVPLVVRVWERVAALGVAERCVIATDHAEIADAARAAGAEFALTDARHPSGTDRVAEVVARPEFRCFDSILNVQGDEPFVSAEALRGAVGLIENGRFPLATAAVPASPDILRTSDVVKVVRADDGRALYFSRAPIPFLRDEADSGLLPELVLQHLGVYAYTRDALAKWVALPPHPLEQVERLEQLRPMAAGIPMGVALLSETVENVRGIDTEDDLEQANERWSNLTAGWS
ncbi:MAG TPA: 3-deoxy-manno-octulosonate cytidylyltransferase [Gemmatimonadaceae bacterium]|nr:3-deoxy-manno-octulosonate cytidylyltransferase [Gemmatimonadaceae bacterium]